MSVLKLFANPNVRAAAILGGAAVAVVGGTLAYRHLTHRGDKVGSGHKSEPGDVYGFSIRTGNRLAAAESVDELMRSMVDKHPRKWGMGHQVAVISQYGNRYEGHGANINPSDAWPGKYDSFSVKGKHVVAVVDMDNGWLRDGGDHDEPELLWTGPAASRAEIRDVKQGLRNMYHKLYDEWPEERYAHIPPPAAPKRTPKVQGMSADGVGDTYSRNSRKG